jgi:HEAT repeat protein
MPSDIVQTQETAVAALPPELESLLRALFAGRRTSNLYQPHHPIAASAREAVCAAFRERTTWLQPKAVKGAEGEPDAFLLTASEGALLINGVGYRQTPDMRAMAKRLRSRGIDTVVFRQDIDPAEVAALFAVINEDVSRIRQRGGPAESLRALGVSQIQIVDLAERIIEVGGPPAGPYAPPRAPTPREQNHAGLVAYLVGSSDALSPGEAHVLHEELKNPTQVTRLLTEVAHAAGGVADEEIPSDAIGEAVQRLESTVNGESPTAWQEVKASVREGVALLPPKLRPNIFRLQAVSTPEPSQTAATGAEGEHRQQEAAPGERAQLGPEMSRMIGQVIDAIGRANQEALQREAASDEGVPQPAEEEPEELATVVIDLGELLRSLAAMKPAATSPAEELKGLMESIRSENYPREIALVLSELLEAETRLDAYSEIADELERGCRQLMAKNDRAAVLIPLSTFARHAGSRGLRPAGQEVRAAAAIQALGVDNLVSFLADLLRTATPAEAYAAGDLVAMVSLQAPAAVVQLLSEPLPSHSEAAIADALIKMGAASVPALAKVVRDRDVGAAVSAVRILTQVPGSESLRALEHGLESDDTAIRLAIVQCVGRTQRTEAAHILLRILSDPDLAIRRAAAESLGRLRFEPALHALSKIAESRSLGSDALTERLTAIDALGKTGGADAIAALARILVRRTWLRKATNDRVRVAAVRALARIGSVESLEVIDGFRRDSRAAVRQACQAALDESVRGKPAMAEREV